MRPAKVIGYVVTPGYERLRRRHPHARAAPREAYLPDWLAVDWETMGGRVCVCDEPIPDDWTYFEVLFSDVNFVAVSPVAGDPEE